MKRNREIKVFSLCIAEALAFIALFCMVVLIILSQRTVDPDIHEAADTVLNVMDQSKLQEENTLKIRDRFGLSDTDYADAVYYGPVSNMDVEELLILKFAGTGDESAVKNALQERVSYQKTNFDGYGTDQMSLLDNAKIFIKGNYAVLIISENADQALALFKKALKGEI